MALSSGTKLGPYQVTDQLGKGGMGEVYRATDTRLDRTVAIKVLPEHFASSPQRRERFEREAKAVSSLNHPHICTLHDVGDQDGTYYLVMELVEGETLESTLERGRLPLDKALEYAIQMADALDKAHRQGVVHRDLKPANIMLTRAGVKLLDFGLAKLKGDAGAVSPMSQLSTQDAGLTAEGTVVGTLQYMAPEQVEGQDADARTDIFSFGAVLYEMLTGRKAFEEPSQAGLIGAIMKSEPLPLSKLLEAASPLLERVVRKCMAKSLEDRWQTARDLCDELKWVASAQEEEAGSEPAADSNRGRWKVAAGVGALTSIVLAFFLWLGPSAETDSPPFRQWDVDLALEGYVSAGLTPALSRDGSRLVFVAEDIDGESRLFVHEVGRAITRELPGTEGASWPFFSPDGGSIAFFSDNGQLWRTPVEGGTVASIAFSGMGSDAGVYGSSWGEDFIATNDYFSPLFRIPLAGGEAVPLTELQGDEITHRFPQVLPGGDAVIFTASSGFSFDEASIEVVFADDGRRKRLVDRGSFGRYVPAGDADGHLVYVNNGTLYTVGLDREAMDVAGDATPILFDVEYRPDSGEATMAFSRDGGAYRRSSTVPGLYDLVFLDQTGRIETLPNVGADFYGAPTFSPDGRRLAVGKRQGVGAADDRWSLWIADLERGSGLQPLTSTGLAVPAFTWNADGDYIYYSSPDGISGISVDPLGDPVLLVDAGDLPAASTFGLRHTSSDGEWLFGNVFDFENQWLETWYAPLGDENTDVGPWTRFEADGREASWSDLSPDGRWMAFFRRAGSQVMVADFPSGGRLRPVTEGVAPIFSRNNQLFFLSDPGLRIMVLDFTPGSDRFDPDLPRLWGPGLELPNTLQAAVLPYDLHPDGERFAVLMPPPPARPSQLTFLENLVTEIRRVTTD